MNIERIKKLREQANAEMDTDKTHFNLKQILADPEKAGSFRSLLVADGANGLAERLFEKKFQGASDDELSDDMEELIRFVDKFNKPFEEILKLQQQRP